MNALTVTENERNQFLAERRAQEATIRRAEAAESERRRHYAQTKALLPTEQRDAIEDGDDSIVLPPVPAPAKKRGHNDPAPARAPRLDPETVEVLRLPRSIRLPGEPLESNGGTS